MPNHQLIQRGPKDFYCTVCHQQWQSKSKAHCPGLHVVKSDEWGTLMTRTMLDRAGYKNDFKSLPEPTACYRRSYDGSDPEYVMLYDRTLCEKKKVIRKGRRKTGYLSELVLTPLAVKFIERYQEALRWQMAMNHSDDQTRFRRPYECGADLCNVVSATQLMTDKELTKEGFITVEIHPTQFRKGQRFEATGEDSNAVRWVADRILTGYEIYLTGQQPATQQPEQPAVQRALF